MSNRKMVQILFIGMMVSCLFLTISKALASENEDAIKNVLKDFERAYNAGDVKAAVSVFHPDAKIKSGGSRISRQEYESRLPERIDKIGRMEYEKFRIKIDDNKAKVKVSAYFSKIGKWMNMEYIMVLEQGKWLIMDQDF